MSRFFAGTTHPSLVEEATLNINAVIRDMNHSSKGEPTSEQIVDFTLAFTEALFRTGGPFKAILARGARGPVDPIEFDFLYLLATEHNAHEVSEKKCLSPLSYYRELLAMDDLSDESQMTLNKNDIEVMRSMVDVDPATFVHGLINRRNLSDAVCVAKLLFGDKV